MKRPKIVVLGSSVAKGQYSDYCWALRLKDSLEKKGWEVVNLSARGADTFATFDRFLDLVPQEKPDVVIIALSLANEGLITLGSNAVVTFLQNMIRLVSMITDINAIPMLAGVYPHNKYSLEDYELLKHTKQQMEDINLGWRPREVECVFDFLSSPVDDGSGHWREGMYADEGHPNDIGHKLMFENIPLGITEGSYFL